MGERCASRSYLQLVSRERKWRGKPSTTQLIQGTMCAFLKLTKDYAVSPDDRAFMVNGTKGHAALEGANDEFSTLEYAFNQHHCLDCDSKFDIDYKSANAKRQCPECSSQNIEDLEEITGTSDFLEEELGMLTLGDYKLSGSYKVARALGFVIVDEPTGEAFKSGPRKGQPKTRKILKRDITKEDKGEWELQLNDYRIKFEKRISRPIDRIKLQCTVRDGNTYIARSRGVFRNVYYFNLTKLDDVYVLDYFRRKRDALLKALKEERWEEPCNAKENWDGVKCSGYCEVAEFCPLGKYLKKEKEAEDMAIKNLSEIRRVPRLGKIRLGIKKSTPQGKEYPAEVDYFILDPETPSELENKKLVDEFKKRYGEQPKQIPIMLPIGDVDVVFPQFYKRYGKTTLLQCKGDGVEAVCSSEEFTEDLTVTGKTETGLPKVKCLGPECPYQKSRQCGRVGTLQILLPELPGSGVWQVTTGSFNSIVNINSCLAYVRAVAGRFHMIPLLLERREQLIQRKGEAARKHYILHINLNISLLDLQRYANIDATKIMLELPEPEEGKEDILFQENETINVDTNGTNAKQEQEKPKDPQTPPQKSEVLNGKAPIDIPTKRKMLAMGEAKKWSEKTIEAYISEIYDVKKIDNLNMAQAETVINYIKNI